MPKDQHGRRKRGLIAALLSERFPADPLAVPHRVFCILAGQS